MGDATARNGAVPPPVLFSVFFYSEGGCRMEQLKREYRSAIKHLETLRDNMNDEQRKADGPIIGNMISDLRYALEWLNSGRRPGNRRGVERLAAYQREKLVDPLLIQQYFRSSGGDPYEIVDIEPDDVITKADKERLEDAMCELTKREKEMYLMSRGHCLSYDEIAWLLDVEKCTVQTTVKRAEKKISQRISESLFCLCG